MKILFVVPTFYPATYFGGPVYSSYGLCNTIAQNAGVRLRVLTTDSAGAETNARLEVESFPAKFQAGYDVYYCRKKYGAEFSPEMLCKLREMISWADIIHLTGVYSVPTIPTLLFCRILNKPVVWSARGSLQRWEKTTKKSAKRIWESICNRLCCHERTLLHFTSEKEENDSRGRITKTKSIVISNGVDIPEIKLDREWQPDGNLRLLFIGRLHPIKGIEHLLQALSQSDSNVHLKICGSGKSGYTDSLYNLVHNLNLKSRVTFYGHVDGEAKIDCFNNSDVCIMPSYTENYGLAAAEALAHGVPVVVSKGTPWTEVEKKGCGLCVDNSPGSLAMAIRSIRNMDIALMGKRGRKWMKESYSWDAIADRMLESYHNILGQNHHS